MARSSNSLLSDSILFMFSMLCCTCSFERIGNQIKSFFWSEEKGASVKKDLSEDLEVEAREPRFETVGYENYEGGDYVDGASEKAAQEETEEDIGL